MNDDRVDLPRAEEGAVRWESLREWSVERLSGVVPALLERLKEPDADEAASLLLRLEYELVPHLQSVLRSGDARRKAAALERVVRRMPKEVGLELTSELIALAMNPSEEDAGEGVDELAEEALAAWL
ncbi:DUF5071 domain-containing protein [Paenibacillus sp.]|uniref:DUF5071 domain-containing protein n=1 Tax=Paenibacillus sp. TaxID=58172 RepID=UPI002D4CDFE3|nr:DUF5071 domain-containing protein [Paenibacillus sp.]HZG86744.1 DUF5071 domain-containing protein [Paenibacillus sp.]